MKTLRGSFIWVLIIMNIVMGVNVVNTEVCAYRWTERVNSVQKAQELNMEIRRAHEYSESLVEAVRMLALENGILCERDKVATEVVVQYEEESRRLKMSLGDACKRLEEQIEQINKLFDEVDALTWQVKTLERALDKVNAAAETPAVSTALHPTSNQSDKKGSTE